MSRCPGSGGCRRCRWCWRRRLSRAAQAGRAAMRIGSAPARWRCARGGACRGFGVGARRYWWGMRPSCRTRRRRWRWSRCRPRRLCTRLARRQGARRRWRRRLRRGLSRRAVARGGWRGRMAGPARARGLARRQMCERARLALHYARAECRREPVGEELLLEEVECPLFLLRAVRIGREVGDLDLDRAFLD
jgi:hypothetical protein